MTVDIFLQFFLAEKNEVVFSSNIQFHRLLQQLRVDLSGRNAVGVLTVPVRFGPAVCGQSHIGVFQNVVLEVLDVPLPANKKKRVLVVQHTHFIRHKQFSATLSSEELRVIGFSQEFTISLIMDIAFIFKLWYTIVITRGLCNGLSKLQM